MFVFSKYSDQSFGSMMMELTDKPIRGRLVRAYSLVAAIS